MSEEDRALWRKVSAGVDPIKRKPAPESEPPPAAQANRGGATAAPRRVQPIEKGGRAGQAPPKALPGAGLDRRSAERLRRGKYPIEARLDLHGHTLERAHRRLDSFIAESMAAGRRAVLVITGKGREEGQGVLRRHVPIWLTEGENARRILAVRTARPADGGDGALYVLLRRQRPAR